MKNLKTRLAAIFACALSLIVLTGFKTTTQQGCKMVVGIAWKKTSCTSGTTTNSFSYAAGYRAAYAANKGDYNVLTNQVKAELKKEYGVESFDVSTTSSSKQVAVIITYDKPMSGWNCSVTKSAVGFGDTKNLAETEAVRIKGLDYKGGSYDVLGTVYCQ